MLRVSRSRGLNDLISRRSNKRLNATALKRCSYQSCLGRRVIRGVGRLVAEHEGRKFAGYVMWEKTVTSSAAGAVQFPSCWRESRAAGVVRSALSQSRAAAQQAHARDRPSACLSCTLCGAARDAQRWAASHSVAVIGLP